MCCDSQFWRSDSSIVSCWPSCSWAFSVRHRCMSFCSSPRNWLARLGAMTNPGPMQYCAMRVQSPSSRHSCGKAFAPALSEILWTPSYSGSCRMTCNWLLFLGKTLLIIFNPCSRRAQFSQEVLASKVVADNYLVLDNYLIGISICKSSERSEAFRGGHCILLSICLM